MKSLFLLDPSILFFNHGSFGACPKPVFDVYQQWQLELERQPVAFLGRRVDGFLDEARAALATYLHVERGDDLVFVQNATAGVNVVAKSLPLQPGDEILTTDHEYGACNTTWQRVCAKTGAVLVERTVTLPLVSDEVFIDDLWAGVTPKTRVIYLSHITSPTALIFPVTEICRRARQAGIITVIDGAHAPGQFPLDLTQIDADFYTGNCHKWMCSAKGSAFLHVRREHQAWLEPLVTSWGYTVGDTFISRHQMQGTRDPAAFLSVPAAIQFLHDHNWDLVRDACHDLAVSLRQEILALTGLAPICDDTHFPQMFTVQLPPCDPAVIKTRLYDDYHVELPVFTWKDRQYLRVSIQGYNTPDEGEQLLSALRKVLAPT